MKAETEEKRTCTSINDSDNSKKNDSNNDLEKVSSTIQEQKSVNKVQVSKSVHTSAKNPSETKTLTKSSLSRQIT